MLHLARKVVKLVTDFCRMCGQESWVSGEAGVVVCTRGAGSRRGCVIPCPTWPQRLTAKLMDDSCTLGAP